MNHLGPRTPPRVVALLAVGCRDARRDTSGRKAEIIPTNCVFQGTDLIMTDAGVLADSADASFGGQVWRIPLGAAGLPTWTGTIG